MIKKTTTWVVVTYFINFESILFWTTIYLKIFIYNFSQRIVLKRSILLPVLKSELILSIHRCKDPEQLSVARRSHENQYWCSENENDTNATRKGSCSSQGMTATSFSVLFCITSLTTKRMKNQIRHISKIIKSSGQHINLFISCF